MMRIARYLLAVVSLPLAAAADAARDIEHMQSDIELHVSNQQFMGAVLVARGGRLLINRGYGFADLEWNIPNTPDTRFRIGSVTKQFTAAAILLLREGAS
jgi:CubicO group peptidase (beta-lactamase class C family)